MDIVEPYIIGTAGHIDHGKTRLVKALTDIDTDRLRDEIERGMSIELGFAWLEINLSGNTHRVGIVDVPGHDRFISTMVFGAGFIDFAILVIDSLQGIQAQTVEHYNVIKLLGITNGIVVLTKIDRSPDDLILQRIEEAQELVKDSLFYNRIMLADSLSGKGIDELKKTIYREIIKLSPRRDPYPIRLDIDRVFSLRGHGLIGCGTCCSGTIKKNQDLIVLNNGKRAVVKNIQVHNHDREYVIAGQRTALNLKGISMADLRKGYTLSLKGQIASTSIIYAEIKLLYSNFASNKTARIRFLYKTREIQATLSISGIRPDMARIRLDKPAFVCRNDRFIIREFSGSKILGGGRIIFFSDRSFSVQNADFASFLARLSDQNTQTALVHFIGYRPFYHSIFDIMQIFCLDHKSLIKTVDDSKDLVLYEQTYLMHNDNLLSVLNKIRNLSAARSGRGICPDDITSLGRDIGFGKSFIRMATRYLAKAGLIIVKKDSIFPADVYPESGLNIRLLYEIIDYAENQDRILDIEDVFGRFSIEGKMRQDILDLLSQDNRVLVISGLFMLSARKFREIEISLIDYLNKNKSIKITEFKHIINASRKYALPLLEYFDSINITYRIRDLRYLDSRILK